MMDRIEVPPELQRNSPQVAAAGYEHTGQLLIELATRSVGLSSLEGIDILDVGCGVRFAATIVNRRIPIGSYTGIEVNRTLVEFLKTNIETNDPRFRFFHWDARNEMYNAAGAPMTAQTPFPVRGTFDLIWLFSVFTHLNPDDSLLLLRLMRQRIRDGGKLFFSAFIDDRIDGFEDRVEDKPLENAYYGASMMRRMLEQTGWKVLSLHDPVDFIQHYFVCEPS